MKLRGLSVLAAAGVLALLPNKAEAAALSSDCATARIGIEMDHLRDWSAVSLSYEGEYGNLVLQVEATQGYYISKVEIYLLSQRVEIIPFIVYEGRDDSIISYSAPPVTTGIAFSEATGCRVSSSGTSVGSLFSTTTTSPVTTISPPPVVAPLFTG